MGDHAHKPPSSARLRRTQFFALCVHLKNLTLRPRLLYMVNGVCLPFFFSLETLKIWINLKSNNVINLKSAY